MKNKECLGLPPMIPMQHCNVKSFCGKQRWMSCCSLYCQELFFDCFRTGTYLSDSRETHAGWWSLLNCETAVYAERNLFVMSNFIVNHSVVVSLYTEYTTGWMQKKKKKKKKRFVGLLWHKWCRRDWVLVLRVAQEPGWWQTSRTEGEAAHTASSHPLNRLNMEKERDGYKSRHMGQHFLSH